jgi:SpoVK/Ycf46/Vps4 family AAA+-type ATPase
VRSPVTLADVAGLDDVKKHINTKLLAPIRNSELAKRYGRTPSGGLLMWGPPGCGKTFIARALAGTLDVDFSAVGMDEILDMWTGSSEKNLATLFAAARRRAPCVLFFDEADAIGGRRSRMVVNVTMRSVVTQMLTELDGAVRDNTGVFTIGATNLPWDVDPALRRPGRFDRTLFVPPPDKAARIGILANRLSDLPLGDDLNLARIADMSRGRSGADVGYIVENAADDAFNKAVDTGVEAVVDQGGLERAARGTSSSIGDWIRLATTAAEASDDAELYGPFFEWLDTKDN